MDTEPDPVNVVDPLTETLIETLALKERVPVTVTDVDSVPVTVDEELYVGDALHDGVSVVLALPETEKVLVPEALPLELPDKDAESVCVEEVEVLIDGVNDPDALKVGVLVPLTVLVTLAGTLTPEDKLILGV